MPATFRACALTPIDDSAVFLKTDQLLITNNWLSQHLFRFSGGPKCPSGQVLDRLACVKMLYEYSCNPNLRISNLPWNSCLKLQKTWFFTKLFLVFSGVWTVHAKAALIVFVFARRGLSVLVKASTRSHQAGFYHELFSCVKNLWWVLLRYKYSNDIVQHFF